MEHPAKPAAKKQANKKTKQKTVIEKQVLMFGRGESDGERNVEGQPALSCRTPNRPEDNRPTNQLTDLTNVYNAVYYTVNTAVNTSFYTVM